jgi:isopentenyl phosphate kinase
VRFHSYEGLHICRWGETGEVIVLKLGGSLITRKNQKFSFRGRVMKRLACEIKAYSGKLIIVHGGGSYGHPLAYEYRLNDGYEKERQLKGLVLTHLAMEELNKKVVKGFIHSGLKAVSLQTSAIALCNKGEVERFNLNTLREFLTLGIIPVLYGDVVLDSSRKFCILSGDRIVAHLSKILGAEKAVLAIDKDGIFNRDPDRYREANIYSEVTQHNYEEVRRGLRKKHGDVTGGIEGKLQELWSLAEKGTESLIVNGLVPGRLQKALLGQEVIGTRIRVAP